MTDPHTAPDVEVGDAWLIEDPYPLRLASFGTLAATAFAAGRSWWGITAIGVAALAGLGALAGTRVEDHRRPAAPVTPPPPGYRRTPRRRRPARPYNVAADPQGEPWT